MTPKQRVLRLYPGALCGKAADGMWWIVLPAGPLAQSMGVGSTAARAWRDALSRMLPPR